MFVGVGVVIIVLGLGVEVDRAEDAIQATES